MYQNGGFMMASAWMCSGERSARSVQEGGQGCPRKRNAR